MPIKPHLYLPSAAPAPDRAQHTLPPHPLPPHCRALPFNPLASALPCLLILSTPQNVTTIFSVACHAISSITSVIHCVFFSMSSVSVNKWSPSTTTKSRVSSDSFFTSPAKSSRKVASGANEYQPTENTSVSEDDSIAQQDSSTKTGKNSHQDPRADRDRSDNYGLLATRLASTATHDEINSIQARIEELKARKETAEDVLEQANKKSTKESEQAKEDISEKPKLVVAVSYLKSVELDDFVNNTWYDCNSYVTWALQNVINQQPHAIDVLVGNACYFWQLEPEPVRDHADLSVVPERIPINSRPLLTFLTKPTNKNDGKTYSHVV
ncbi:hypothetical protein MPH_00217 [Macrophomina phaseolina MS6]|uniref:Uncharacterized protein n=1 Tax=Macrophomina phaseolina (strain MS6) TaxID=1126212 RepID=K2SC28_MACPH|nr:hypothetical protein MPH_00217 [Macrophomina phaseolina MS6]